MKDRDVISVNDLSDAEVREIISLAVRMKASRDSHREILPGRAMAMIFEKPSLRTRVTFEVAIASMGGYSIYLGPTDVALGKRESVEDVARNLERWVDIIVARVFSHDSIKTLAQYSKVPVINALSDLEHPCQALADIQTVHEHKGNLKDVKLTYVGDANNVCNSLFLLGARLGMTLVHTGPKQYQLDAEILQQVRGYAQKAGGSVSIIEDPKEALEGSDVVYTDIWTSMGQESQKDEKDRAFAGYQVNAELMSHAKPNAIFMHCLPAHRGEEVTDEVVDSPQSVVFDQAENRLHAQKALVLKLLGGDVEGGAGWQDDTRA